MHRLAGLFIAALLILPSSTLGSESAFAGEQPQFWQSSETVVRVVDLPDIALFKRGYKYVDLGYHFLPDGSGNWVSYEPDGRHRKLDVISLGVMLDAAELNGLPPIPSRPPNSATYLFFAANGLVQLTLLFRIMMKQHHDNQGNKRRKNKTLQLRSSAIRKKIAGGKAQQTNSDSKPEPTPYEEVNEAPAIAQRGLQAVAKLNIDFGRRGW